MKFEKGLVRCGTVDLSALRRASEEAGYLPLVLPTEGIVDRATFFDAVRAALPLNPPLQSSHVWDAMADSLWEGLDELPEKRIAILWVSSSLMARHAPEDFATALDVLSAVAENLADEQATVGEPKEVCVVVAA